MELILLTISLTIFPACVLSQVTITESGGGVKRPGETMQLTCTVSGFSVASSLMDWAHWAPGKGLVWSGRIWSNGNVNYNSGLQDRITITRDTSKNQVFLQLRGLKLEDSATYYYARDTLRENVSHRLCKNYSSG
uniref:Immunoglobulin V-set domain-containing protein n=1 Tax=Podarcis muralis TaxID=64176 RepID=A0A670K5M9_PODMU